MDDDQEEPIVTTIEVQPGEAALVFRADGLQAYLPDAMAEDDESLPWHLLAAQQAMEAIDMDTARVLLERHLLHCRPCREAALINVAKHLPSAGDA